MSEIKTREAILVKFTRDPSACVRCYARLKRSYGGGVAREHTIMARATQLPSAPTGTLGTTPGCTNPSKASLRRTKEAGPEAGLKESTFEKKHLQKIWVLVTVVVLDLLMQERHEYMNNSWIKHCETAKPIVLQ